MIRTTIATLLLVTVILTACSPQQSIKLGLISSQTGSFSDLGTAGMNGAILAVEDFNRQQKISRPVTLLIRDDEHNPAKTRAAFESLLNEDVAAVIGPMTSAMATELVPLADSAKVVLMGGTVVTDHLSGKDDHFLRAIASTKYYAAYSADIHLAQLKPKRVKVVFDAANRDYAENWAKDYAAELKRQGIPECEIIEMDSRSQQHSSAQFHARILQGDPDLVTFVSSARTTASLIVSLRKQRSDLRFAVTAWAANRLLLQQAGASADGTLVEQYHDIFDQSPAYLEFATRFRQRFKLDPDYAAVITYDATNIILTGLAHSSNLTSLKEALLAQRTFKGLQTSIELDHHGDAARSAFTTTILDGKFVPLERVP